ncbi:hypothetical protein CDAR_91831 [Caerostris darwini]|uniref:Uncharacterized protein n=1 Tax=Caerostris darwini TaxID=1538125 RepID=A0AAV4QQD6_9ARAC|nr:hypothetical protein CDAR_91831 [Caerostris darwini]
MHHENPGQQRGSSVFLLSRKVYPLPPLQCTPPLRKAHTSSSIPFPPFVLVPCSTPAHAPLAIRFPIGPNPWSADAKTNLCSIHPSSSFYRLAFVAGCCLEHVVILHYSSCASRWFWHIPARARWCRARGIF